MALVGCTSTREGSRGVSELSQPRHSSQLMGILSFHWPTASPKPTRATPAFYNIVKTLLFETFQKSSTRPGGLPKASEMSQNYQQPPTFLSITL